MKGLIHPLYINGFQIWTLKESYIKCTGEGMSRHLKKLNFHVLAEHIDFLDSTRDIQRQKNIISKVMSMIITLSFNLFTEASCPRNI